MDDEDEFLSSIGAGVASEEDAALAEMGATAAEAPAEVPPGYRETGRESRVLTLPETTVVGDPTGRGRGSVSMAEGPATMEVTREIERMPKVEPGTRVGPDPRSARERLAAYFSGADPRAFTSGWEGGEPSTGSVAGMELPNIESVGRAIRTARRGGGVSDVLSSAFPNAPGAGAEARSAPTYGALQALTLGHADELGAALGGGDGETYEQRRDSLRRMGRRIEEQAPGTAAAFGMSAMAPLAALAPEAPTVLGSQALGRMLAAGGVGLGTGTIRGLGESEAETVPQLAEDAVRGGLLEGGLSTLIAGGGEGLSAAMSSLGRRSPQLASGAQAMADEARIEAANLMPNPAPSTRQGRDMARLGGQRGLAEALDVERIGGRYLPTGGSVADDAQRLAQQAGRQFDEVLAAMDQAAASGTGGGVSRHEVARRAEALLAELDALDTRPAREAAERVRNDFLRPWLEGEDQIGWQAAHNLRQHLDEVSGAFRRATDPTSVSASGGTSMLRGELSDVMGEATAALRPETQQAWRDANRRYQLSRYLEQWGRPSPGRHAASVAEGTAIGEGNVPGAMLARTAASGLARLRPGLQARGLQAAVPMLRAMGPRMQRAAAMLEAAAQRSPQAAAAAHFLLSRQDPEYRSAMQQIQTPEGEE